MSQINSLLPVAPFNQIVPPGGPKAIPANLDFTGGATSYQVDMGNAVARNLIEYVQCIYADNRNNSAPLIVTMSGSNQVIVFPAQSEGYLPVLAPNPPVFNFTSTGGIVVPVYFINVPIGPMLWSVNGQLFQFDGSGNLKVSDVALDAIIQNKGSGNGLNVNVISGGGGGGSIGYTPTTIAHFDCGSAFSFTMITASPRYYLESIRLVLDGNAFNATSGNAYFTWQIQEFNASTPANILFGGSMWVPNAAPAALVQPQVLLNISGLNYWNGNDGYLLKFVNGTIPSLSGGSLKLEIAYATGAHP
jgi:hypothetical protein